MPVDSIRVSLILHPGVFYHHPLQLHALHYTPLSDEGRGSGALVPPGRGQDADGLVVARQAVDTGLDENEAAARGLAKSKACDYFVANVQLGVLVLAVGREVLADGNGLLDQHVEVLGDLGGEA